MFETEKKERKRRNTIGTIVVCFLGCDATMDGRNNDGDGDEHLL